MLTEQFYDFMKEREAIRIRRKNGLDRSMWTSDPIFQTYKFTNVKRVNDWTTQQLLQKFYAGHEKSHAAVRLANCTVARFLGLAESVIELEWSEWSELQTDDFAEHLRAHVADRKSRKQSVFTGAYIVPNVGSSLPKHEIVIQVVNGVVDWACTRDICGMSFQALVEGLCTINGMGSFMAKEVILDFRLISPEWQPGDWETWTPIGPGACRGAARAASDDGALLRPLSEPKALAVCRELYEARHDLWPAKFMTEDKEGVKIIDTVPELELCDIQFQLCEFDKYLRVKLENRRAKTIFRPRS